MTMDIESLLRSLIQTESELSIESISFICSTTESRRLFSLTEKELIPLLYKQTISKESKSKICKVIISLCDQDIGLKNAVIDLVLTKSFELDFMLLLAEIINDNLLSGQWNIDHPVVASIPKNFHFEIWDSQVIRCWCPLLLFIDPCLWHEVIEWGLNRNLNEALMLMVATDSWKRLSMDKFKDLIINGIDNSESKKAAMWVIKHGIENNSFSFVNDSDAWYCWVLIIDALDHSPLEILEPMTNRLDTVLTGMDPEWICVMIRRGCKSDNLPARKWMAEAILNKKHLLPIDKSEMQFFLSSEWLSLLDVPGWFNCELKGSWVCEFGTLTTRFFSFVAERITNWNQKVLRELTRVSFSLLIKSVLEGICTYSCDDFSVLFSLATHRNLQNDSVKKIVHQLIRTILEASNIKHCDEIDKFVLLMKEDASRMMKIYSPVLVDKINYVVAPCDEYKFDEWFKQCSLFSYFDRDIIKQLIPPIVNKIDSIYSNPYLSRKWIAMKILIFLERTSSVELLNDRQQQELFDYLVNVFQLTLESVLVFRNVLKALGKKLIPMHVTPELPLMELSKLLVINLLCDDGDYSTFNLPKPKEWSDRDWNIYYAMMLEVEILSLLKHGKSQDKLKFVKDSINVIPTRLFPLLAELIEQPTTEIIQTMVERMQKENRVSMFYNLLQSTCKVLFRNGNCPDILSLLISIAKEKRKCGVVYTAVESWLKSSSVIPLNLLPVLCVFGVSYENDDDRRRWFCDGTLGVLREQDFCVRALVNGHYLTKLNDVSCVLNCLLDSDTITVKVFPNTDEHRRKLRLWSSITLLCSRMTSENVTDATIKVIRLMENETLLSVQSYMILSLSLLLCINPDGMKMIIERFNVYEMKPSQINAFINVAFLVCQKHISWSTKVMGVLVPWCMSNNYTCRAFVTKFIQVHSPGHSFLSFIEKNKETIKALERMNCHYMMNIDLKNISMELIFHDMILLDPIVDPGEAISVNLFERLMPYDGLLPLSSPSPKQQQEVINVTCGSGDIVQRKIIPLEHDLNLCLKNEKLDCSMDFIVVASLLTKATNIGGLTRTCEVLGMRQLILASLDVIKEPMFQQLSVTSEKHLSISAVAVPELLQHLLELRSRGYSLIGIEQTSSSLSLQCFEFPSKSVLVLGKEKEGVPVKILRILDYCIEVPQFGVIRSLNVHVCASIVLWEARKQWINKNK